MMSELHSIQRNIKQKIHYIHSLYLSTLKKKPFSRYVLIWAFLDMNRLNTYKLFSSVLPLSMPQKMNEKGIKWKGCVCSTHYNMVDAETHTILSSFKKSIRSWSSATPAWHLSPSPFRWLSHFSAALPRSKWSSPVSHAQPSAGVRQGEDCMAKVNVRKCFRCFYVPVSNGDCDFLHSRCVKWLKCSSFHITNDAELLSLAIKHSLTGQDTV